MSVLGNLMTAVHEQQDKIDTEPIEHPETHVATEDFQQAVPPQQDGPAPDNGRPTYPTPVQVKEGENGTEFSVLLNCFEHPKSAISLMQLLASAGENDTIRITISNVGGFIYGVLAIAAMIKASKAKTIGVFSMVDSIEGVIVWLACKERTVAATPCMFIESIKYGNQGSVVDQLADSASTQFMQNDLLKEVVAAGIMTEEEVADFSKHESVFSLFGEPLKERLVKAMQQ